jgi:hypothetical protein
LGRPAPPALLFVQDEGQAPLVLNVAKTTISGDFSLQGLAACGVPFYSSCVLTVTFTPTASGIRTGILTIASNDPSLPTISVPLEAVGYAAAPVPQITSLNSQLVQAGAAGTNLSVRGYGFLPSSIVEVGGVPQPTTYDSDTALGATLAASSIPANSYGELAVTVVTPAPGGGTSAPYTLTEFQLISAANVFMIYEPVSKQLFTSTPAAATANPNTVVPINPVTATVGTPIPVGNDPGVLAASADGKYLYVGLNADHTIQRINLSTSAIERTFPLPVDPTFGKLTVFDMHVVPGSDTEVAASLMGSFSPGEEGIALFNDAGLVNWIPSLSLTGQTPTVSVDRFTFTNSPSTLYAIVPSHPGFAELTYSSAGLEYAGASCCVPANNSQSSGFHLATDGTLLYTDTGSVWNPANNGQIVGTYAVPAQTFLDSVIPDTSTGKTYYLNQDGATTVLAFDQTSLAQTASLSLDDPNLPGIVGTQLVRWGTNGFAFRGTSVANSSGPSIFLFTSSIVSAANLNAIPVATTLTPASTPAAGPDFVLTVNGSGFIPGSTVEWNGSPRLTTVVSSTQLTTTVYASDIAVAGTAQVNVASPGQGGISALLTFTITGPPPSPIATLSPPSLTFASQAVGTSSSGQAITLGNSGNADLTGIAIAIGGADAASFAQTSTCGTTVAAGGSCVISIVFTPASAGTASATLTVTSNAGTSPQSVGLSGTAPQSPFAITPQPGGASSTVTAGQPATYALSITAAQGYSGTLALTCTNLPANASCSFAPSNIVLAGGKSATFTATIATAATQTGALLRNASLGSVLATFLFLLPLSKKHRRGATLTATALLLFATAIGGSACGGGSSSSGTPVTPPQATVAPGTYTVQVVASDGTTKQTQPLTLVVQ